MAKPKYNGRHQRLKEQWRPIVDRGEAHCTEPICLMPTRHIHPGTPWDLAHGDTQDTYRGPAHATCNRSEGGRRGHAASCRCPTHQHHSPKRWAL